MQESAAITPDDAGNESGVQGSHTTSLDSSQPNNLVTAEKCTDAPTHQQKVQLEAAATKEVRIEWYAVSTLLICVSYTLLHSHALPYKLSNAGGGLETMLRNIMYLNLSRAASSEHNRWGYTVLCSTSKPRY